MTNRSHATFRQLPRNIYRELSDPGLDLQSTLSIHRAIPSTRGLIELDGDEASSDPISYGMDDVIKHLRGACGVPDSISPAVAENNRDSREEDDHD